MSVETTEENLARRQEHAKRHGWKHLPEIRHCDAECPYCGASLAFEYDYEGETDFEEECPACGRPFDVTVEWEPSYLCSEKGEVAE